MSSCWFSAWEPCDGAFRGSHSPSQVPETAKNPDFSSDLCQFHLSCKHPAEIPGSLLARRVLHGIPDPRRKDRRHPQGAFQRRDDRLDHRRHLPQSAQQAQPRPRHPIEKPQRRPPQQARRKTTRRLIHLKPPQSTWKRPKCLIRSVLGFFIEGYGTLRECPTPFAECPRPFVRALQTLRANARYPSGECPGPFNECFSPFTRRPIASRTNALNHLHGCSIPFLRKLRTIRISVRLHSWQA